MVRRGRGIRRRRTGRKSGKRIPRSMFNAISSTGARNPRASSSVPWNTVTLQRHVAVADESSFSITLGYLFDALCAQLGLPTAIANLSVRLKTIQMIDLTGRPMQVFLHDYIKEGIIGSDISYPGRNTWSSTKMTWPSTISSLGITTSKTNTTPVLNGSVGSPLGTTLVARTETQGQVLMKIQVLWRSSSTTLNEPKTFFAFPVASTSTRSNSTRD